MTSKARDRDEVLRGRSAGQNEPRWNRLRKLIDSYPKDSGILKELIQNADDGKARHVELILDETDYSGLQVHHQGLASILGPAILAFNDRPFEPSDFENLSNLANSAKIEDAFKTGRFGLGFNSVYNVTDFPVILSADTLWCLDPCETLLNDSKGGTMWFIKDLVDLKEDGFLKLFDKAGYTAGSGKFDATAIRLPLRNSTHVGMNQEKDVPDGEARISSQPFTVDDFLSLVEGLSKIAHELLLFLKNVESVTCARLHRDGNRQILLEIAITNGEEVRQGREKINEVLRCGRLDDVLPKCIASPEGKIESCFPVTLKVQLSNGHIETSLWTIVSGLYAGYQQSLAKISRELAAVGERGLPHAGVAICIQRGRRKFPETKGKVFCYLPIADKDYTGCFPVHIHGAFSLDDSRTRLSGHREDAHDGSKQSLRAKWNECLLDEGAAHAYASALTQLTRPEAGETGKLKIAAAIYNLFPPPPDQTVSPLDSLASGAYYELGQSPVFLDCHQEWKTVGDMYDIPDDEHLENSLCAEGYSFARPKIPDKIRTGLQEHSLLPPKLTAGEVKKHFRNLVGHRYPIPEHPFPGLRSEQTFFAIIHFLIAEKESDWSGLPLGLCCDGLVGNLSAKSPLMVVSERVARILAMMPDRLAPQIIAKALSPMPELPSGFEKPAATTWLPMLGKALLQAPDKPLKINPTGSRPPTPVWLVDVMAELNELNDKEKPPTLIIDSIPLVPDSVGVLHRPGTAGTPLLLEIAEQDTGPLLKSLGVAYYVMNPAEPLSSALRAFSRKYRRVRPLKAPDLIDSIHAKAKSLAASRSQWAKRAVTSPLLRFIESRWDSEELAEDDDRLDKLRELPIFEDQHSRFDVIDTQCFRQGDFTPPKSLGDTRLLRDKDCSRILEALDVKPISRISLLEDWILPNYSDQEPEDQREWLRWIRDDWNHLIAACAAGREGLSKTLSEVPLIQTNNGELKKAHECYHPESRSFIISLLGETASFPDSTYYSEEIALWNFFFDQIGVKKNPGSQDLARRVTALADQAKAELTTGLRQSLVIAGKYLFSHWADLRKQMVALSNGSSTPLAEYLKTRAWLPAASGSELSGFLVKKDPEARLYQPRELLPHQQGHLVATTCALLPPDFTPPSTEVQSDLGINFRPNWKSVADHFTNLLEFIGEGPFTDVEITNLKKPLRAIYRFFGESPGQFLGTEQQPVDVNPIARRFSKTPCIIVQAEKQFRCPENIYQSLPRKLHPLKYEVRFADHPAEDKGLEVLGRSNQPSIDDLASTLVRLAAEQESPFEPDLVGAINRTLELLGDMIRDVGEGVRGLPEIAVLNAAGFLRSPSEVVAANDPWLLESLRIERNILLDPNTPESIIRTWEIAGLRDAAISPAGFSAPTSKKFQNECLEIEGLIQTEEFIHGLKRIIYHDQGKRLQETHNISLLRLEACSGLQCTYKIIVGSESVTLGKGGADYCLDSKNGTSLIRCSEECEVVLYDRFADALCRVLAEDAPQNTSALVKILQHKPAEISGILDQLRIRHMPQITEDETDATSASTEPFLLDSDDAEDLDSISRAPENACHSDASENETSLEDYDEPDDDDWENEDPDCEDSEDNPKRDKSRQNSSQSSSGRESEADQDTHRNATGAGKNPSGGGSDCSREAPRTRGRMIPGKTGSNRSASTGNPGPRQQDAIWISRPAPARAASDPEADRVERENHAREERISHSVDSAAMDLVIQYERTQGRKPQKMAHANPGYDVESKNGRVIDRYIEVKGIDGAWGINGVALSSIQFATAQDKGDQFWLYVVENARDPESARIHLIQNPLEKITHHRFDRGWRLAGQSVEMKDLPRPKTGMTLSVYDDDGHVLEGKIISVEENGKQLELRVRYENGGPSRTEIFNLKYMSVRE